MRIASVSAVVTVVAAAGLAQGGSFGFFGQSDSNQQNTGTGEDQLVVDVFETGISIEEWWGTSDLTINDPALADVTLVDFVFRNVGADASVITGIYFDDDAFQEIFTTFGNDVIPGAGVDFGEPADPTRLEDVEIPGGGSAAPEGFTTDFSLGATDPDELENGINQGEMLTLRIGLLSGVSLDELLLRIEEGLLQIGLLVKGFEDGGIETFVNKPEPVVVPAPLGGVMAGLGLGFVVTRRRR